MTTMQYIGIALTVVFLAAAILSWTITFRVKRLAEWLGCVDLPDDRKIHTRATPRLGGLSIVFGFGIPLLALAILPDARNLVAKNLDYLLAVLASGAVIIALGVYDDLFGSNASKKFTFQSIAGLLLILFGFHFDRISLGFEIELGWAGPLVTLVWIVGVINAINFIDGMDGLATLVTFTLAVTIGVIAWIRGDVFSLVIMTALAGSLLGFLPWNWRPAKIFMGDTGSQFIGLLLVAMSIARNAKSPTALVVAGPFLALALPVLDTLFVMKGRFFQPGFTVAQRFFRLFNADRSHLHHILDVKYGSHAKAVFFVWVITLAFGAAGVLTVIDATRPLGYALALSAAGLMIILRAGTAIIRRSAVDAENQPDAEDEISPRAIARS